MLLKLFCDSMSDMFGSSFSTLYRVDAIEAVPLAEGQHMPGHFQYPLSGRCY